MMDKVIYILRKRSKKHIKKTLTEQFNLKLCYDKKAEKIFKNNDILITCKKKYISILIYDESTQKVAKNIIQSIS